MQDNDYSDIIDTKWPKESSRQRMPLEDRAKIFLPFAALKGFEEEIEKREKSSVERVEEGKSENNSPVVLMKPKLT